MKDLTKEELQALENVFYNTRAEEGADFQAVIWKFIQMRGLDGLIEERDTLLARVAELEREAKQWEAEADFQRARADQAGAVCRPTDIDAHNLRDELNLAFHQRDEPGAAMVRVLDSYLCKWRPQPSAPNAGEAPRPTTVAELTDDQIKSAGQQAYGCDWDAIDATHARRFLNAATSMLAPAPVAADAGLTEAECAQMTSFLNRMLSDNGKVNCIVAKYLELRPQPARLRMPTVNEVAELHHAMVGAYHESKRREEAATIHEMFVAFLRTLGAEIVEGGAKHVSSGWIDAPGGHSTVVVTPAPDSAPVAVPDARWLWSNGVPRVVRNPSVDEAVALREALRGTAPHGYQPSGSDDAVAHRIACDFLRDLMPPPGSFSAFAPAPDSAPVAEPSTVKEIEARAVDAGDEVFVNGWQHVRARSNISGDRTLLDLGHWTHDVPSKSLVTVRAAPAPAREPEPDAIWLKMDARDMFAVHAWTSLLIHRDSGLNDWGCAVRAYKMADEMMKARRRVEGEEAGK